MKKQILYGEADYANIIHKNGYFVDKTEYIAKLERVSNAVFLRPRRFGKSLFCSMLKYYYDVNYADRFEEFFGHTWIGQNLTGNQNKYIVLLLDFSSIDVSSTIHDIERSFKNYCNSALSFLRTEYAHLLADMPEVKENDAVSDNLSKLTRYIRVKKLPPMYIIIDEYDNFANQLIIKQKDKLYNELTGAGSFLKTFFKVIKSGRGIGAVTNVFITGILPMSMEDLASAFNVALYLTLTPAFEAMLGFTQSEVETLLDEIYHDYQFDPETRNEVLSIIKNHYNGYHFVNHDSEPVYNSTILMYFLQWFTNYREFPKFLTDSNLRTDLLWIRRLTGSNPTITKSFVDQLTTDNKIFFSDFLLTTKFNVSRFFKPDFFPISFFYLGMLTRKDHFNLCLPNMNMRHIFVEYFNEIHNIDITSRYSDMMQSFLNQPNLEKLFANYWQEYVSQLPTAIFQKMNENFYRTTFYKLCSDFLSQWFIWHLERSYPQGQSDLEFVGKYHEKFAGMRWVIEFKYYSNREFKKFKTTIADFELQTEDLKQIAGYVEGLKEEYPKARISQFVIYCFGNQGFRVFEVKE
ncbi:MAG: AAA family ATPase [Anaerolineaceae bacterium 4572_78]|nr:MAG: AAA family ATPase [Anaerolineaceae bacterium 4572_78]